MTYRIVLSDLAKRQISDIRNPVIRREIESRIDLLCENPELGKPLRNELAHYRSLRAGRNRYRIIYQVVDEEILVTVIFIGERREGDFKDVYRQALRLLKAGGNGH